MPIDKLRTEALSAWFGSHHVLKSITMAMPAGSVTAIIGPSGCGKSTFVRCLNRIHETVPHARMEGRILLDDRNIIDENPVLLRRNIGMVFQKPNPFPTMSIFDNVAAGLRLAGQRSKSHLAEMVEKSLVKSALWDEVKDKLFSPATRLSGGQQQRLCIARALAVNPDVLLMDEPCSALDPISTARVEELIHELRGHYTIVIVTHNMQQAARVSDYTAFFLMGEVIEHDHTQSIFTTPKHSKTEDYITGRFG